jgi:hypothetical protein
VRACYVRGVARLLTIIAFMLFLGQVTGASALVDADTYIESCPGERPDGDCSPRCDACSCCPTLRPIVPLEATAVMPAPTLEAIFGANETRPPSPEPDEILHVPKFGPA